MNVTITFKGGPMDGTFDFPNYSPYDQPENDPTKFLAWAFYTVSGDEVGKSSGGVSPAILLALEAREPDAGKQFEQSNRYSYVTSERMVEGDTVRVVATYLPGDLTEWQGT